MNARSHAGQAAADDGDVTPVHSSLLLVRACLLNGFDPFVSRATGLLPMQVTAYWGRASPASISIWRMIDAVTASPAYLVLWPPKVSVIQFL